MLENYGGKSMDNPSAIFIFTSVLMLIIAIDKKNRLLEKLTFFGEAIVGLIHHPIWKTYEKIWMLKN